MEEIEGIVIPCEIKILIPEEYINDSSSDTDDDEPTTSNRGRPSRHFNISNFERAVYESQHSNKHTLCPEQREDGSPSEDIGSSESSPEDDGVS